MHSHIIPTTFASQHPDHASVPYWKDDQNQAFISANEETQEVFVNFKELGILEYKWDWEGKLVDESVVEKLLMQHLDFFKQKPLGKERFLTYRLPNPYIENEQRLGRAFMGMLSAAGLTKSLGLPTPPMQQMILPMCESAHSMMDIQEAFREMANLKHWLFDFQASGLRHIQIIPLFEQVDVIANSDQILSEYLALHQKNFGFEPTYLRPYVARSDPSLNSGHIATLLSIKIAFSKYRQFEIERGIKLYPMIGCAALLFRGGLTPENVDDFLSQYAGVRTVLIQSGFRYDYPLEKVKKAIKKLNTDIPKYQAEILENEQVLKLTKLMRIFEKPYRETVETLAATVNFIAKYFPKRRERVQHIGLFGYSRGIGKVTLPRAIKFTGSLYSLGIPPSLIGAGRGMAEAEKKGLLQPLSQTYLNLKKDYQKVACFVNLDNLKKLAEGKTKLKFDGLETACFVQILEDIKFLEKYLAITFSPQTEMEQKHQKLTTQILKALEKGETKENLEKLITEAGKCRRSLG